MIELNTEHIGYSFMMEVLCCLPREPEAALLQDMVEDFGFDSQAPIVEAINALKEHYPVQTMNVRGPGRRGAYVASHGWAKAKKDAQEYWDRINGGKDQSATARVA